jgi:hypothetical protein
MISSLGAAEPFGSLIPMLIVFAPNPLPQPAGEPATPFLARIAGVVSSQINQLPI